MQFRWKQFVVLLLAMVILLVAGAVVWITSLKVPKKPTSILQGDYTDATTFARRRIEHVMKQRHIPGAAAVLVDDQETIWQAAFGLADLEQDTPVTEDTVFKMWSLAKPFTALELMRLVEEGRIDLDAPLDTYVPGFSIHSRFPGGEPMTLRHILAHRSGLPRNACRYGFGWETGPDAVERLADALQDCFLAYPVGNRYKYSNIGYVTVGYIIQAQRGHAFPAHMRDELLLPIGMASSAFYSTDLPAGSELALGYEFYHGEYYPYAQADVGNIPSSNLYATPGDLAIFVKFLFRGGEANGAQLIRPDTLQAMFADQYSRPADPQRMGLGWRLGRMADGEPLVWHDGGAAEGTGSLIAMLPERKLGVVLVGNATTFEGSVSLPIAMEILEVMLETRDGLAVSEKEQTARIPVDVSVLEKYAGAYAAFGDILEVTVEGAHLQGTMQGMRFDLVPVAENRFRVDHWLLKLGLADLLQLPMDLGKLTIAFRTEKEAADDTMIVDFGGVNTEIYPRYPRLPEADAWDALAGKYEIVARLPSGQPGPERLGETDLFWEDGHLFLSGSVGPILPIGDNTLIILGGPFHGETITRDPETGLLFRQDLVYRPVALASGQDR